MAGNSSLGVKPSAWTSLDLSSVLPPGLSQITSTLSTIGSAADTVLKATATVLQLLSNLAVTTPDPVAIAIQQATSQITNLLTAFTAHTNAYLLPIPLLSTGSPSGFPVIPGDIIPTSTPSTFLPYTPATGGGNAGFYSAVVSSLNDPLDAGRPQFGLESYVAGLVLIYGASDITGILEGLTALQAIMGPVGNSLSASTVAVPQNLIMNLVAPQSPGAPNTVVVGTPNANASYAVQLTWDLDPVTTTLPQYNDAVVQRTKILILRDTNPIDPVMTPNKLQSITYDTIPFNGVINTFVDDNISPNTTYYYAVAYAQNLISSNGTTTPISSRVASNSTTVNISNISTPQAAGGHGVPPDWLALPTPMAIFPPLQTAISSLTSYMNLFTSVSKTTGDQLQNQATFLTNIVTQYSNQLTSVLNQLTYLTDLFTPPAIGLYTFTFSGSGGNAAIINALNTMLNSSAAGAPSFSGSDTVGGFVLMAGSNSAGDLAAFEALIELIAGPSESNPVLNAINQVAGIVQQTTNTVVGQLNNDGTLPTSVDSSLGNLGANLQPSQLC